MIFPLEQRLLIRGVVEHIAAGLKAAADYEAVYVPVYAPVSGEASYFKEDTGGDWLRLKGEDGLTYEFAHLKEYHVMPGHVEAGMMVALSGNSGTITTGPHLHIQIKDKKGKRLDPEVIFKEAVMPGEESMSEDNKVALLMPQSGTYWEAHHGRALNEVEWKSIETELRKVIRGELNFTDLLTKWAKGL